MTNFYSTGSSKLDKLLGGGLELGDINHFYGEDGAGKTTVCLQSAIKCIREGSLCVFISSTKFSSERFKQLIRGVDSDIAEYLLVFESRGFEDQRDAIYGINEEVMDHERELGLVIVDDLTHYYNPSELVDEERIGLKRELVNQLIHLLGMARKKNYTVVITNQVYEDIDTGELRARGGKLVFDVSKKNVELKKVKNNKRLAILREPSLEPIDSVSLRIEESGVH